MEKKYELLAEDCLRAGDRTVYRIRALKDFGEIRRGDVRFLCLFVLSALCATGRCARVTGLGGYSENESSLAHGGKANAEVRIMPR